jgi:hypothetical protein
LHQYNKQQSGLIAILIVIIITTTRQTYTTLTSILLKISSLLHRHQTAFNTFITMDTNTNSAIDNVCAVCPRPGKLCSVCKDVYYCCRSRQKDDWPIHKLVCKQLALGSVPGMVLTLYFPVDGTEPTTTSFPPARKWPVFNGITLSPSVSLRVNGCSPACSCEFNTYDIRFNSPSVHDPLCQYIYVSTTEQRYHPIMHNTEGLKVNRCIETLTGDTSWMGSVIALAKNPKEKYVNIGTSAFSRILDAVRSVRGVRINCDGIVQAQIAPRFESVTIKSYDLRGAADDLDHSASSLTQHTGIVLQDRKEPSLHGDPQHSQLDQSNFTARLLLIPCDINESNFGSYRRPPGTGNIIVMREDRKPLDVNYMEILCDWLEDLLPLFKMARADCGRIDRDASSVHDPTSLKRAIRQIVFGRITKQNLLAYSNGRLKDEDIAEDEKVEDVVENQDTTDDEMPGLDEGSEASDDEEDNL